MNAQFQSVKNLIRKLSREEQEQLLNSQLWNLYRIEPRTFAQFRARTRVISLSGVNNQVREETREEKNFKSNFPNKSSLYFGELDEYDIPRLIEEIKKSDFLKNNDNLGLQWCLNNYNAVMGGKYRNFVKTDESKGSFHDCMKHNYSPDVIKNIGNNDIEF